jgi:hypothetical protein
METMSVTVRSKEYSTASQLLGSAVGTEFTFVIWIKFCRLGSVETQFAGKCFLTATWLTRIYCSEFIFSGMLIGRCVPTFWSNLWLCLPPCLPYNITSHTIELWSQSWEPQTLYTILALWSPVVTMCTTSLTFSNSTFCPRSCIHMHVLCGSQNKQRLFPYTALTDWFL